MPDKTPDPPPKYVNADTLAGAFAEQRIIDWIEAQPEQPALVGTTGAAKILGVPPARIARYREDGRMPPPWKVYLGRDVWLRSVIEEFAKTDKASRRRWRAARERTAEERRVQQVNTACERAGITERYDDLTDEQRARAEVAPEPTHGVRLAQWILEGSEPGPEPGIPKRARDAVRRAGTAVADLTPEQRGRAAQSLILMPGLSGKALAQWILTGDTETVPQLA